MVFQVFLILNNLRPKKRFQMTSSLSMNVNNVEKEKLNAIHFPSRTLTPFKRQVLHRRQFKKLVRDESDILAPNSKV